MLVDFAIAVEKASLTARQAEALRLVYVEDLTQKSAGERMGIERSALTEHLKTALDEIDAVFESWAWISGGLTKETYEMEDAI